MADPAPRFTVIVPTRGDPRRLQSLLDALGKQTFPRAAYEVVIVFDGAHPDPELAARLDAAGAHAAPLQPRSGPGAARNAGARAARAPWLAFTEDDVTPARDWLERAAARLDAEPEIDVLEGATLLPGGRSLRVRLEAGPQYLPTNLFVRREAFERIGGYYEAFFDPSSGAYFREDADLGFSLEAAGARVGRDDTVRVTHPDEHPGLFDPLRWAGRYVMDPLLAARHPERFRERIEVHRLGPFRVRRPIVRASVASGALGIAAVVALAAGSRGAAGAFLMVSFAAALPIAFKWRDPWRRIPVALLVPYVIVAALIRGGWRARRLRRLGNPPNEARQSP